jgi:ATP-dependent RNA helicase DHX57
VAVEPKVTTQGNVAVKQWQKLPSELMANLAKKEGRKKHPQYRRVGGGTGAGAGVGVADGGLFRYRLVLPDEGSNRDKDVVLTSACAVDNEEQAKEEAAILGLMYLYPALPHERTLPEPYRSTYLAAKAMAMSPGNAVVAVRDTPVIAAQDATMGSTPASGASTNVRLVAAGVHHPHPVAPRRSVNDFGNATTAVAAPPPAALLTKAQKDEARRLREVEQRRRARKREAMLEANKPMEVFMSSRFRRRIELCLKGEDGVFEDDENGNDDGGGNDIVDDNEVEGNDELIRSYVLRRLTNEGFDVRHVSKAYRETTKRKGGDNDDEERAYEEALQYLCIHLREDDLPVGFDPRGGTLDVIRPGGTMRRDTGEASKEVQVEGNGASASARGVDNDCHNDSAFQFARFFGLTLKEAAAINSSSSNRQSMEDGGVMMRERCTFWNVLTNAASLPIERTCCHNDATIVSTSDEDRDRNEELAANEREAMEAIFKEDEFSIKIGQSLTSVFIALPFRSSKLSLEVHYTNKYPDLLPMVFVTSGKWSKDDDSNDWRSRDNYNCGGRIQLKLVRYVSEMAAGQEVIFDLYGYVHSLLQEEEATHTSISDCSELLSHIKLDNSAKVAAGEPLDKSADGDAASSLLPTQLGQKKVGTAKTDDNVVKNTKRIRQRIRPREERATFWNTHPSKTPPAVSCPKLSTLMEHSRRSLPAAKAREEFLTLLAKANAVDGGRVLCITGETGCGKTTQIPQFILENSPDRTKIIVAQPRRLAATGVASRVASERAESNPGTASVGYVVRGDSKTCSSTRLLFCTTGVLLRQLQSRSALENITHIVIDEVHERHLDSDVLLAILKQTLPSVPHLTVVLMSATMDADRFAKYFGEKTPRMHIPGFTHPVQDFMLEDVLEMTGYIPPKNLKSHSFVKRDTFQGNKNGPDTRLASMECAVPLDERLKRMNENEIDYSLISLLVKSLLRTKEDDGSILVFLPGAGEIDRAERAIQDNVRGFPLTILPLHGGLQAEKQAQVFLPARKGFTKIILSTNVAETSITIPDCTIVVDTCKEKQSSFDPVNRMPLLLEQFASQDSLRQRRGRAGRVRPGTCYKLISSSLHSKLSKHGTPEIRRCALDQTILSLLFLGLEDGSGSFLRILLDPPDQQQIKSALYSLEKIGALDRIGECAFLTPLGTHLAGIPAPPVVGKLLIMGCLLGCRDISVAIAAVLSAGRTPFLRIDSFHKGKRQGNDDPEQEKKAFSNKQILEERAALFKMVGNSDHVMLGKAFLLWEECGGAYERKRYCDKLGLSFNGMREIQTLTRQLDSSLTSLGFYSSELCNENVSSWRIVKSVVVASLSPTQIVRVQRPTTKYTETVEGAVEKEGQAKELKFFIRSGSERMTGDANHDTDTKSNSN